MTALRRTGHWAAMVLGPLLVVVTVLAGVTLWAVRSAPGTRTVLQALPWVRVTAPEGALLGDFAAQRLEVPLGPGKVLTLQDVRWEGLKLEWQEKLPWRFGLHLDSLHARLIDIALNGPPQAKKSTPPPQSIALPFAVHVEKIAIGELRAPGLQNPTLTQIQGRVSLGADNGRAHIADQLQASWGPVQFNGEVRIATQGTMAVMSQASIERNVPAEPPALHWQGSFKAEGPLAKLNVSTNFQTAAQSDMQSLQAQATVTPFVAPGLPHLQVQTQGFDLQALHPRAPHTALSGKILLDLNVQPNGAAPLLKASAALKNGAPASFEAQGLPVSALTLQAATDLQHPEKGVLQTLRVTLADAQGDAGTLEGTGSWAFPPLNQGAPSTLDATLQASLKDVRTRALHRTAPAMSISGPLNLQVKQLSLQPASQARATQRGGQVSMDADLRANDMGNTANDNNQIDTKIDAKLSLPPLGVAKTAMQWLAQLRGTAQADLQPNSRFAGVPLQGHIELAATSDRHPVQAKADLQAATTRLTLDGALDTQGSGADDRWTMHLSAPDLALLTPLLPKALAERAKPKGQLDAEAQTTGRWPALQTQGHLDLRQLHWDQIALAQTHAQWEISPQRLDAPLALRIAGADLQIGPEHLSSFTANAQGSLKKHTIDAQIDRAARLQLVADATAPASTTSASASSASPPASPWMQALNAQIQAEGGLSWRAKKAPSQHPAWEWQAQVTKTLLQPTASTSTPWFDAQPFALMLKGDGPGNLQAEARDAHLALFGTPFDIAAFQWRAMPAGSPLSVDLDATLPPTTIAPLLQRAQPGLGWRGDLTLNGHIRLHSQPNGVQADIELARQKGDLSLEGSNGLQNLGLEQLRLALTAKDGEWHATEAFEGRNLGTLSGEQRLYTARHALFPQPDATLQGQLKLQIADLEALGPWLPISTIGAGWRLGGALNTQIELDGRLNAPRYTGNLHGERLSVRNTLEGINLTEGLIDLQMEGEHANIDAFHFKGGAGELDLGGQASFGHAPHVALHLDARQFALLQRVDRKLILSGNADLAMTSATRTAVTGQFRVDEGLIDISRKDAPTLGDDVTLVNSSDPESTEDEAEDSHDKQALIPSKTKAASSAKTKNAPPKRQVQLKLDLDAGDNLKLKGRGIDTLLKGQLRLSTQANTGKLQANGAINTDKGSFAAFGQSLDIERGHIEFTNAIDNPRLDIQAVRPPPPGADDTAVRVGVIITGTAQEPHVRLFSEPEMSETDKLSWLILGQSSEGLSRNNTAVLSRAATALLAGESGGSDGVFKTLGIDELSISQGDSQTKETIVKIGKQLSRRWYWAYERSLNATSGTWEILYRIAQSITIRAQWQQGENRAIDVIRTWKWE